MSKYQIAQLNIATLLAPIDSPQLSDFVANLDRINAFADDSPGFVWRLQTEDGDPHVSPIGHVFFRDDMTGYYFDAYSKAMPKNFGHNKRVCLMGVNSGTGFWLKSLFRGQFNSAPAVRLFGEVTAARQATQDEMDNLQNAIRITSKLKGHKLLWSDLTRVRDIKFDSFSPATYPAMCEGLWK